jgi:hypothetical protein
MLTLNSGKIIQGRELARKYKRDGWWMSLSEWDDA